MSDPMEAFEEAVKRIDIADANTSGLSLSIPGLEKIPAQIESLKNLKSLYVNNTRISSDSLIYVPDSIEILDLGRCEIDELRLVPRLTKLRALLLYDTKITSVTNLKQLKNLKVLNLSGTHVSDLSPLAKLPELIELDISRTDVKEIFQLLHFDFGSGRFQDPDFDLSFEGCLAARNDPVLAKISLIENGHSRFLALMNYFTERLIVDDEVTKPDPDTPPLIDYTPPAEFATIGDQLDLRHKPRRSEARHASATPVDPAQCARTRKALHQLVKTLCKALRKYKREDIEQSNRVRAAEQLLLTSEDLGKALTADDDEFLPVLMQSYVEALEFGLDKEILSSFERNDIGLYQQVLSLGRQHYACYPELAEIADPANTRFISDKFPYSLEELSAQVNEILYSVDGQAVFSDETRALVEAELEAKAPQGADDEKTKLARLSAIVSEMYREMIKYGGKASDGVNRAATWLKTYEKVEKLWNFVKPFIGKGGDGL